MSECPQCYGIIRKNKEMCEGCRKFYHGRCLVKNTKNCYNCIKCAFCGEKMDNFVECKKCERFYHKECNDNDECVLCIEDLYKTLPLETLYKLEINNFNIIERPENEKVRSQIVEILKNEDNKRDSAENKVPTIFIGNNKIQCIYQPPYSEPSSKVYLCSTCLSKFNEELTLKRHRIKCEYNCPPGKVIYKEIRQNLKVFEIDGRLEKIFCRNLCMLGKAFIGHKTLYYDVEPFVFYLLTANNQIVGYFSREKESINYNLSCVVVLPCYQGMGYGYFLVDLSYILFKRLNKVGSPEKPLSDSAQFLYNRYWMFKVYNYLENNTKNISINTISKDLAMAIDDVIIALELLEFLKKNEKYKIQFFSKKIKNIRLIDEKLFIS